MSETLDISRRLTDDEIRTIFTSPMVSLTETYEAIALRFEVTRARREEESLRLALETATRERDEARAAALVAVEERRSFQKAHDLSERHRGPLERVRSAAYDLFQALDWEAPGWRDETCAERGDATNKAWFELEAALNFAAECDSSHSRPAPPAPRGEFAIIASLVAAMKRWGSEEDGVPDFAWKAYTAGAAYIVTPPPPSDNKGCAA